MCRTQHLLLSRAAAAHSSLPQAHTHVAAHSPFTPGLPSPPVAYRVEKCVGGSFSAGSSFSAAPSPISPGTPSAPDGRLLDGPGPASCPSSSPQSCGRLSSSACSSVTAGPGPPPVCPARVWAAAPVPGTLPLHLSRSPPGAALPGTPGVSGISCGNSASTPVAGSPLSAPRVVWSSADAFCGGSTSSSVCCAVPAGTWSSQISSGPSRCSSPSGSLVASVRSCSAAPMQCWVQRNRCGSPGRPQSLPRSRFVPFGTSPEMHGGRSPRCVSPRCVSPRVLSPRGYEFASTRLAGPANAGAQAPVAMGPPRYFRVVWRRSAGVDYRSSPIVADKLSPAGDFAPSGATVEAVAVQGNWIMTRDYKWLPISLPSFGVLLEEVYDRMAP